ncbi:unnamed protein product [Periconia digitata]|uniref:Uncharacterized protein n=1 Tax=Periconia digitata TaxID=1303443 RepID=A0A9W4XP86_9PLEO|nr:unnamed protein product [Periconia digitata]
MVWRMETNCALGRRLCLIDSGETMYIHALAHTAFFPCNPQISNNSAMMEMQACPAFGRLWTVGDGQPYAWFKARNIFPVFDIWRLKHPKRLSTTRVVGFVAAISPSASCRSATIASSLHASIEGCWLEGLTV